MVAIKASRADDHNEDMRLCLLQSDLVLFVEVAHTNTRLTGSQAKTIIIFPFAIIIMNLAI